MPIVAKKSKSVTATVPASKPSVPMKKCAGPCNQEYPIVDFPLRKDRSGGEGRHRFCKKCKSAYETEKRALATLKKTRDAQRRGLKGLPSKLWSEGSDSLWLTKEGKLTFDTNEFECPMDLSSDARKKIIIALGGIFVD